MSKKSNYQIKKDKVTNRRLNREVKQIVGWSLADIGPITILLLLLLTLFGIQFILV